MSSCLFRVCIVLLFLASLQAADRELTLRETAYRVEPDGVVTVTIHERWRAITGEGRTELSSLRVPYISSFETLEFTKIFTVKKDGTVVDGDASAAFDTSAQANASAPMYDDSRYRTVLPPSFETGDSVEYEAVMKIQPRLKPGDFWAEHYAPTGVPVLKEIVVLDYPSDRKVALHEMPGGKVETAGGRRIERWELSRPEPEQISLEPAEPVFAVSSLLTWDAFGEWIASLNEKASQPTPEIAALAAKLTANQPDEQNKIAALYGYVVQKIRYTSVSFALGRFQPHNAATVLHNGFGDCKDQTALLTALLKAVGLKAHPVLIAPGVGVLVPDVPTPNQFSHEFVAVETKRGLAYLDPSIGPTEAGVLSVGTPGYKALLVGERNTEIVDIPLKSAIPNRLAMEMKGKIDAAGVFQGSLKLELQGFAEVGMRRMFADATDSQKELLLRALAGREFQKANVRRVAGTAVDDLAGPFKVECEISDEKFFAAPRAALKIGAGASGLGQMMGNVTKPEKPLPIPPVHVTRNLDVAIDPSFTITNGMPVHRKESFGSFDAEFGYDKGHLTLASSLQLTGAPITAENWKAFVDLIGSTDLPQATSFTLERHVSTGSTGGLTPLMKAIREGAAAYQKKDYEAAKNAYLEATKLDSRTSAWNDLGRAYAALHDYRKAESAYRKQIEVNPNDRYAYNNLGLTLRATKREEEAIEIFRKQIAISPTDRYAHDNLSISFANLNRWEEALREAKIAADIAPDDANKLYRLARAQARTGHREEALRNSELALAQPHDAMMENNIAYYLADMNLDLNRAWDLAKGALDSEAKKVCHPEAAEADAKCIAQLRNLARMLDTVGWTLYRQGKVAEAEPYLRSCHAILPHAEVSLHYVVVLAKLQRWDEAASIYAEVRTWADFARLDSSEAQAALGKAPVKAPLTDERAEVTALVDGKGRVVEARGDAAAVEAAKGAQLLPIAWPDHEVASVRTVELRRDGGQWSVAQSYVVKPAAETAESSIP